MTNINWTMFLYFVILNLIYVIMNTISSILCIKGSKGVSSIASAICYGFYTIVLKTIVGCDTFTTVVGTIISNIVGRYLGMWLSPIFIGRPIVSYKFTIFRDEPYIEDLFNRLEELDLGDYISWHYVKCQDTISKWYKFTIYSKDKDGDKFVEALLKEYDIDASHKEEY